MNNEHGEMLSTGWVLYRENCAELGPEYVAIADAHQPAIDSLPDDSYLIFYYRHPVVVRKPRPVEWAEHRKRMGAIREETKGGEKAVRIDTECERLARECVIYPDQKKLDELCQIKYTLLGECYDTVCKAISDAIDLDVVKLRAR